MRTPRVVRMLKTAAGEIGVFLAGEEYSIPGELPPQFAHELVDAGAAEWLEGVSEPRGPKLGGPVVSCPPEPGL